MFCFPQSFPQSFLWPFLLPGKKCDSESMCERSSDPNSKSQQGLRGVFGSGWLVSWLVGWLVGWLGQQSLRQSLPATRPSSGGVSNLCVASLYSTGGGGGDGFSVGPGAPTNGAAGHVPHSWPEQRLTNSHLAHPQPSAICPRRQRGRRSSRSSSR